jgi:hypothetical protein
LINNSSATKWAAKKHKLRRHILKRSKNTNLQHLLPEEEEEEEEREFLRRVLADNIGGEDIKFRPASIEDIVLKGTVMCSYLTVSLYSVAIYQEKKHGLVVLENFGRQV